LLLCAAPIAAPSAAWAQPVAAASEALFRAGRDAMQHGDPATACAKFRESYRLEHALGTLLNIGVCEEALGELGNAWQQYQEVIHALPSDDERVAIANQHLVLLEPRLPRLTVHRSAVAPEDTHASIGGVELGAASFDVALPMDPGSYVIEASSPGRAARSYPVELHEGDHAQVEIEPGEPQAAAGTPAVAGTAASATGPRRILHYRNPMDPSVTSPVPMKDGMGMDYVPVYSDEVSAGGGVEGHAAVDVSPDELRLAGLQTSVARRGTLADRKSVV
jgi:hypothetical protein